MVLAGRLSVPAESDRWQIDLNLMNITTSRVEPGLTATTGIDHCLWHHGGCSSAAAVAAAKLRFRCGPCPTSCAKHPRGVPTADLSKKARQAPRPATEISRGSGILPKPRTMSTPSDALDSVILRGFQEPSAKRPRTIAKTKGFVRESETPAKNTRRRMTAGGKLPVSRTIIGAWLRIYPQFWICRAVLNALPPPRGWTDSADPPLHTRPWRCRSRPGRQAPGRILPACCPSSAHRPRSGSRLRPQQTRCPWGGSALSSRCVDRGILQSGAVQALPAVVAPEELQ